MLKTFCEKMITSDHKFIYFVNPKWIKSKLDPEQHPTSLESLMLYKYYILFFLKCLWPYSHHHRKWMWQSVFKSWTLLFAFHLALITLRKVWKQLFFFQLRVVIHKAFCLDVAQGLMNRAPYETQTHLWRFASLAC